MPPKAIVVLPTYNEAANISAMLDALTGIRAQIAGTWQLEVLVVDDNSPDGTQDIVNTFRAQHPHIHLLTGTKNGLGAAYIRGMQEAIALGADVLFEMDADFSHDPNVIPLLLQEISHGADFVIGSRYVPGGTIPKEWQAWRKLNSWGGNLVARLVAGIYAVRDCTSGYRAISASLINRLDLANIRAQGYGFQVSILHEAFINGAKIKEIPIQFIDRAYGESKLGLRDIIEFITNAFAIRLQGSKTLVKFLAVGASGVLVNLLFFTWGLTLGLNEYLTSILAIEVSILWNFFLNNFWTFRRRKTNRHVVIKGLLFNALSLVTLGISFATFAALNFAFPSGSKLLFQAAGVIPAAAVNYLGNSYFTFREAPETPPPADRK